MSLGRRGNHTPDEGDPDHPVGGRGDARPYPREIAGFWDLVGVVLDDMSRTMRALLLLGGGITVVGIFITVVDPSLLTLVLRRGQ